MKRISRKSSSHHGKSCVNCGTTRYPLEAREHCKRCYPILLRLERTQRWDALQPKTLRHYPKSSIDLAFLSGGKIKNYYSPNHWQNDFPRVKEHTIRELRKRLLHFRLIEEQLSGSISGYDIELQFRHLARRAGTRNRYVLSGIAGVLDGSFTWEQRKLLFQLLNEVSEGIKWGGINA